MSVTCGNSAKHESGGPMAHASVEAVRACCQDKTIGACTWNVLIDTEDGPMAVECGGLMWLLADGRGYTCEFGHERIYDEVRKDEGWDYAADPEEAGLLAGRGVTPVAMNGGPIDINLEAMRHAASLGPVR